MPKGKIITIPGLSEEYFVVSNEEETRFALVWRVANALRQHQLGIFDHVPNLSECLLQIKALKDLEK